MTTEEGQRLIAEIRALLGDEFREVRTQIKSVGEDVHEIRTQFEGYTQRLITAEQQIAEGKGIVVPLESRVTRLEDLFRRVEAVETQASEGKNSMTKMDTSIKVVIAFLFAIPTIQAALTWFL